MNRRLHEIEHAQVKKDLKKRGLTNEQKARLMLISEWADGATYDELAAKYSIHRGTVGEWLRYYAENGIDGLKRPLKPVEKKALDAEILRGYLDGKSSENGVLKIQALIDLAISNKTTETAKKWGITPQGLLKWKRSFFAGKLFL